MSAWAVVDGDAILSASILCGEHASYPDVLDRVYEEVKGDLSRPGLTGFDQLPPGDDVLANDCVECKRVGPQPVLPITHDGSPSLTLESTEEDPEQAECEEPVEYVHEKMDGLAPVPWDLEILDAQTDEAENGVVTAWLEPVVELELTVTETVHYPAKVTISKRRLDEIMELFPQLKRHNLPLGLMLRIAKTEGARVVVDEKHGDVQGQTPVGPVREGRTWQ